MVKSRWKMIREPALYINCFCSVVYFMWNSVKGRNWEGVLSGQFDCRKDRLAKALAWHCRGVSIVWLLRIWGCFPILVRCDIRNIFVFIYELWSYHQLRVFQHGSSRRRLTSMTLLVAELDISIKRLKFGLKCLFMVGAPNSDMFRPIKNWGRRIPNRFSVCPVVQKGSPSWCSGMLETYLRKYLCGWHILSREQWNVGYINSDALLTGIFIYIYIERVWISANALKIPSLLKVVHIHCSWWIVNQLASKSAAFSLFFP